MPREIVEFVACLRPGILALAAVLLVLLALRGWAVEQDEGPGSLAVELEPGRE